ncbi:CBS domain-containing protein [Micromonospora echinofusca]|uniref:CBS domain-containing protein n=2 Tax=Micromonospora echinofusca TaxID=47858 RepID=A0ABS3VQC0_MICEH|nr:CBS domain-containing protein [Micromonospora echinofusca]
MTRDVVTVAPETGYHQIADLLVRHSISAVPVVDPEGRVLGLVSEADLLAKLEYSDREPYHPLAVRRLGAGRGRAAGENAAGLMSYPVVTISADASVTGAARLIDAAGVKRLPVVDERRHLLGIVSRRDLVRLYARGDEEILAAVLDVLTGLRVDPADLHVRVDDGVVSLAGRVDRRSTAAMAVGFVRSTPGVVDVIDELTYRYDDTVGPGGTDDTVGTFGTGQTGGGRSRTFPDIVV